MDIGARLRAAREAVGLSLASLARQTRVQPRIIEAIELNDLASIPPRPYGRGFVRAYAREVGLDPDQTVRDYFARFAPAVEPGAARPHGQSPPPRPWPPRQAWLVPAVGLFAIVLVALAILRGSDATNEPGPPPVGTTGTGAQGVEPPRPEATVGTKPPEDKKAGRVAVVLEADRRCWVTATADGERVLYQLLQAGDRRELEAAREIVVRAGDAGALRITVGGRETGPLGADGEVRTVRFGAGGLPRD